MFDFLVVDLCIFITGSGNFYGSSNVADSVCIFWICSIVVCCSVIVINGCDIVVFNGRLRVNTARANTIPGSIARANDF